MQMNMAVIQHSFIYKSTWQADLAQDLQFAMSWSSQALLNWLH